MNKPQAIKVTFPQPIGGYWDGGKKSGGTFEPTIHEGGYQGNNGRWIKADKHIEWGCWELNFFFRQAITAKDPTTKARAWIRRNCRVKGIKTELVPVEEHDISVPLAELLH